MRLPGRTAPTDKIVDEAMTQLLAGEPPETIVKRYPEQAPDLQPLLSAAQELRALHRTPPLPPTALASGRRRMLEAAAQRQANRCPAWLGGLALLRPAAVTPTLRRHPFLAGALALMLLAATAGGGALAAADSLPGSPLYNVKLVTERVQLMLAPDEQSRENLRLRFEERRREEQRQMERLAATTTPTAASTRMPATPTPVRSQGSGQNGMPSHTPTPSCTPRWDQSPEPRRTGSPEWERSATPSPTCTPNPEGTPNPTATPKPARTPGGDMTPSPRPTSWSTPWPTPGPMNVDTPTPGSGPGPMRTPGSGQSATPERTPQKGT